ncbi:MAG: PD40 domain-containing protein [Candidatus Schekmanbacteria bacterium]|nr:PD40 domain-containing protein [Candidatus Schekmanbacteria bacterium]
MNAPAAPPAALAELTAIPAITIRGRRDRRSAVRFTMMLLLVLAFAACQDRKLFREGELLQGQSFFLQAVEKYEAFIKENPQSELAAQARERIGECYSEYGKQQAKLQRFDNSVIATEALVEKYADTEAAKRGGAKSSLAFFRAKAGDRFFELTDYAAAQQVLAKLIASDAADEYQKRARNILDEIGKIAFATEKGLWAINPDGSSLRQLAKKGIDPTLSADGRYLAYVEPPKQTAQRLQGELMQVEVETGKISQLLKAGIAWDPSWSPVDDRIAVNKGDFFQIIRAKSDDKESFPSAAEAGFTEGGEPLFHRLVGWSPKGNQLLAVQQRSSSGKYRLVTLSSSFSEASAVTTWKARNNGADGSFRDAAWAPDGKRLAFAVADGVFLVHPSGTDLYKLIDSPSMGWDVTAIAFSPDAKMLGMVGRRAGDDTYHLSIVDVQKKITEIPLPVAEVGALLPHSLAWGRGRMSPSAGRAEP